MIFIVFIKENVIGHVFHELENLLDFINTGAHITRIELWNNGKRKAIHI